MANPYPKPTWTQPAKGSIAYNPKPPKVKNVVGPPGTKSPDSPNYQPGAALAHILTTHDKTSGITSFHAVPKMAEPRPNMHVGTLSPTPVAPQPKPKAPTKAKTKAKTSGTPGKTNSAPTPTKTASGGSRGPASAPTAGSTYTPIAAADLAKYAKSVANAQLAPQLQGNQADIDALTQQSADHAKAVAGFSQAMGSLLAPIGGNISSAYGNAADAVAQYGQGFSSQNQQLKQDAGANAAQADPNMSAAQQAEIQKGYAGTPYDVMYGMNGYDPATSLRGLGAGLGAISDKLPQVAANYGAQWLGASQADTLKSLTALQKAGSAIRAQYPSLYNTALAAKHTADNQDASLQMTKDAMAGYTTSADGTIVPTLERQKMTAAQAAANQRAQASGDKLNTTASGAYGIQMKADGTPRLSASGKTIPYPMTKGAQAHVSTTLSKAYGYLIDTTGKPVLSNGHPIPMPNATGQSLTAQQVNRYHGVASDIAKNAYNGFTDAKGVVHPKVSLGAAMQLMRSTSAGKIPGPIARAELARWYNDAERKRLGN